MLPTPAARIPGAVHWSTAMLCIQFAPVPSAAMEGPVLSQGTPSPPGRFQVTGWAVAFGCGRVPRSWGWLTAPPPPASSSLAFSSRLVSMARWEKNSAFSMQATPVILYSDVVKWKGEVPLSQVGWVYCLLYGVTTAMGHDRKNLPSQKIVETVYSPLHSQGFLLNSGAILFCSSQFGLLPSGSILHQWYP